MKTTKKYFCFAMAIVISTVSIYTPIFASYDIVNLVEQYYNEQEEDNNENTYTNNEDNYITNDKENEEEDYYYSDEVVNDKEHDYKDEEQEYDYTNKIEDDDKSKDDESYYDYEYEYEKEEKKDKEEQGYEYEEYKYEEYDYYIEISQVSVQITNHGLANSTINFLSSTNVSLGLWELVALKTVNQSNNSNLNIPSFTNVPEVTVVNASAIAGTIIEMVATNVNPRNINGRDLVQELTVIVGNEANKAAFLGQFNSNAFASSRIFVALNVVNELGYAMHLVPGVLDLQFSSGGFAFSPQFGTDVDTTAIIILALQPYIQMPNVSTSLNNALNYIRSNQVSDGGFASWGSEASTESTALSLAAIVAMGQNPFTWNVNGELNSTPVHSLIGRMLYNGAFKGWQGTQDLHATSQGFFGLSAIGLNTNIFTNLRSPIAWPEITIPFEDGDDIPSFPPPTVPDLPTAPEPGTRAFVNVADPIGNVTFFNNYVYFTTAQTAYSILHQTGLNVSSSGHPTLGMYVVGINGLYEFSHGPLSGWMFSVNGQFYGTSASNVNLQNGYVVYWLFTRDLGQDIGHTPYRYEEDDYYNYEDEPYEKVYYITTSATILGSRAIAQISDEYINNILVSDYEIDEIIINVTMPLSFSNLMVNFTTLSINNITELGIDLTITSPIGTIFIDNYALNSIYENVQSNYNTVSVFINTYINEDELTTYQQQVIQDDYALIVRILVGYNYDVFLLNEKTQYEIANITPYNDINATIVQYVQGTIAVTILYDVLQNNEHLQDIHYYYTYPIYDILTVYHVSYNGNTQEVLSTSYNLNNTITFKTNMSHVFFVIAN